MSTKVITLPQLETTVKWIKEHFAALDSKPSFTSVTVGSLKLSDDNGRLKISKSDGSSGSVIITLPDSVGQTNEVVLNGQTTAVSLPNLLIDSLYVAETEYGGKYYAMPQSSQDAKTLANAPNTAGGGGIVLTSRNRLMDRSTVVVPAPMSVMVNVGVYTVINIQPATEGVAIPFTIDLRDSNTGSLAEYWIEVNNANICEGIAFASGYERECVWTPSEPDWTMLESDTLLIHVINGIVTWTSVPDNAEQ